MPLIIATPDSEVLNATSYVTVEEANAVVLSRGLDATLTEAHLLAAMDMLAALPFAGEAIYPDSLVSFPRKFLNGLNAQQSWHMIKLAQVWYAYYIAAGILSLTGDVDLVGKGEVLSEKVDILDTTYAPVAKRDDGLSPAVAGLPLLAAILPRLLASYSGITKCYTGVLHRA